MKKPNFIFTVAAALLVAAITTPFAGAQEQVPLEYIGTKSSVKLTKGAYQTVNLVSAAGVTATVTGTVSGTVASLSAAGSYLMATVTYTTVTSTLSKKTLTPGKISNKELLQLIFNTTDPKVYRGYSPVWVSVQDSLLESGKAYIGARKGKDTNVVIREFAGTGQGVEPSWPGSYVFFEAATPNKKNPNQITRSGYGEAGINVQGPLSGAFTKLQLASKTNIGRVNVYGIGKFVETIDVSPAGTVTNSSKSSLSGAQGPTSYVP